MRAPSPGSFAPPLTPATVNGLPGFLMYEGDVVHSALSFGISGGRISTLYMMRNPEKLTRVESF
jgi:hypothetical protein